MDTKADYERKQREITSQLKQINSSGKKEAIGISKQNSNLFRIRSGQKARLDVRKLNKVIRIDKKNLVAEVEGMTTYQDLVDQTLKYGLFPTVVPELATITIGGAISGGGIEASSFKFGLVHETILEMTILLPTGEVITATPNNKYSDLFRGIVNSFGTLGYILKLKVKLIKTEPFVNLRYFYFSDSKKFFNAIEEVSRKKKYQGRQVDFMDGMVIGKNKLYLMLSNFTKTAPYISNYKYMNVFYRSIPKRSEDFLTVRDFIWRWDTDWFWCSKAFGMGNPLLRLLAGKFLLNSKGYWWLTKLDRKYHFVEKLNSLTRNKTRYEAVVQDVQIPLENATKFLDFFIKQIGILPVWICPTKVYNKNVVFPLYQLDPKKLYINFGFWDTVKAKPNSPSYFNRLIEHTVQKMSGRKGLYSESFYTKDEFWKLYPKKVYNLLKSKYDPQKRLKDLYQKCVSSE